MASKNKQQTFGKRNRERAVEEKRRLKRERKEAKRAARAAALEAGLPPPDYAGERAAAREAEAGIEPSEPETTEAAQPQAVQEPQAPQAPQA
jgi:hypothetical protein